MVRRNWDFIFCFEEKTLRTDCEIGRLIGLDGRELGFWYSLIADCCLKRWMMMIMKDRKTKRRWRGFYRRRRTKRRTRNDDDEGSELREQSRTSS